MATGGISLVKKQAAMSTLYEELVQLLAALEDNQIDYALCGGWAMAIHGLYRTTIDIDLLIHRDSLAAVIRVARERGYTIEAQPMTFAKGAIEIRRVSKLDLTMGDVIILDLLLVTPQIQDIWQKRTEVEWEHGKIKVVSRDGLIALKLLSNRPQDRIDIESLQEVEE